MAVGHFTEVVPLVNAMQQPLLQLVFEPGQSIPVDFCWMVRLGFASANSWSDDDDFLPLGVWGPGQLLIPHRLAIQPVELRSLSNLVLEQCLIDASDGESFLSSHIEQLSVFFKLSRVRPAEKRMLKLLQWLGSRFGATTEQGVRLPLVAMKLTHRELGHLCSMTRVTVTKTLGLFRQQGWLLVDGEEEVLTWAAVDDCQRLF
jgi:hypothetical protein